MRALGQQAAMQESANHPLAEREEMAEGFVAFSTSRHFDNDVNTPWREAGGRLVELAALAGIGKPEHLLLAGQVHGGRIAIVEEQASPGSGPVHLIGKCDGLVTGQAGVWLAIRTADCIPIALVDGQARVCGALHAGWRGTRANIMERGIAAMERLGARRDRLSIWIGPGISAHHYEVSEELVHDFQRAWPHFEGIVDGRRLNLAEVNRQQALLAGVCGAQIRASGYCTFRDEGLFHSHRRQGTSRGHQFLVCGFQPD